MTETQRIYRFLIELVAIGLFIVTMTIAAIVFAHYT